MNIPIHFFHANGFPSETYKDLLSNLEGEVQTPISILGKDITSVEEGYVDFVDEVIEHASVTKGKGVAIGHSFGATLSLLAEAKQPGLFKTIILLDPPLFSRSKMIIINVLRKLGLEYLFTPAKKSMNRRETFSSREEATEHFASKGLFKEIPKSTIELYVNNGLEEDNGKYKLSIPRDREVEIFLNFPTKLPKKVSDIKGYLIYADKIRLLDDADLKWWDKAMPKMTKTPFQGSHMFPFEKPLELAIEINGIMGGVEFS
jgi:pimeloyl-ACP methyl ester carboxylesterase